MKIHYETDQINIGKGVRKMYYLFPTLFNPERGSFQISKKFVIRGERIDMIK